MAGAALERGGNWLHTAFGVSPYLAPFGRLGRIRSDGITDLRHGHVLDADWQGHDRFRRKPDSRVPLPLTEGVACYTIAATLGRQRSPLTERLLGDGLVPVASALGQHHDRDRRLAFAPDRQAVVHDTNHLDLLSSAEVYRLLQRHGLTPALFKDRDETA